MAVHQRRGDAEARQDRGDDLVARAEQRPRRHDVVAGIELAGERAPHRRHAAAHPVAGFRPFEQAQALLEHGDRRIAVAGIDEAVVLAGKAPLGGLGIGVDEARIEVERLGRLAVVRAVEPAAHQLGGLAPVLRLQVRVFVIGIFSISALHPGQTGRLPAADRAAPTLLVLVALEAFRDVVAVGEPGLRQRRRGGRRPRAGAADAEGPRRPSARRRLPPARTKSSLTCIVGYSCHETRTSRSTAGSPTNCHSGSVRTSTSQALGLSCSR
jgi:hypothetical protein